jgi:kinesin family protein 3/17
MFYRDLLNKDQTKKYELRENMDVGVYVKDLSSFVCKSVKEIEQVMCIGNQNRKIGYVCNMSITVTTGCPLISGTLSHS